MRLSDEQRAKWLNDARLTQSHGYVGHPMERGEIIIGLGKLALDLADELAASQNTIEERESGYHALMKQYGAVQSQLQSSQRREKRLKRQVELMGWLIGSHEGDQHELMGMLAAHRGTSVTGFPSFDQMGDVTDEGEYTDDDLDMLKDHWPAAREELLRRQMAADNHGSTRDGDAERDYWGSR